MKPTIPFFRGLRWIHTPTTPGSGEDHCTM